MAAGCLGLFGALCVAIGLSGILISVAGFVLLFWLLPGSIVVLVIGLVCCTIASIGHNSAAQLKQLKRMEQAQRAGNRWQRIAPPELQPGQSIAANDSPSRRASACPRCGMAVHHGAEMSSQTIVCQGCGQPFRLL